MNTILSVAVIVVGLVMVGVVLRAVKNKRMNEANAVVWLVGAVGIVILGIFPGIITWVASIFGIFWAPSALVFFLIVLAFLLLFYHTQEISLLTAKLTEISVHVTLLKHENSELKKELEQYCNQETKKLTEKEVQ